MKDWIFRQIDIAALVYFRIIFGVLGFAEVTGIFTYYHLTKGYFRAEDFHFKYYGFEWIHPFPEPFMSLFFILLQAAAVLIVLGKWYRISTTIFAFGFAALFLMEKGLYLNHGYLFTVLSFAMILFPAHRDFSLDVLKKPSLRVTSIPFLPIFLLCFMMGVVYFYGGIAKLNSDWLKGIPLIQWLEYKTERHFLGDLLAPDWIAYFLSVGGVIFDLFITFFLLFRKTRKWAFLLVIFFHLTNHIIFAIGIFPYLSVGITALFFPPDFPKKIVNWLGKRLRFVRVFRYRWYRALKARNIHLSQKGLTLNSAQKNTLYALVIIFCLLHLSIPFRHHYFPGDVTWTEEGHRYSWRMMLRSKQGYGNFTLVNPETRKREHVNPKDYLIPKFCRKMYTHPDMILQFAHYLRDKKLEESDWDRVEVYANIRVRCNYRDWHHFVDRGTNLAEKKWSFFQPSDWILPEVESVSSE